MISTLLSNLGHSQAILTIYLGLAILTAALRLVSPYSPQHSQNLDARVQSRKQQDAHEGPRDLALRGLRLSFSPLLT